MGPTQSKGNDKNKKSQSAPQKPPAVQPSSAQEKKMSGSTTDAKSDAKTSTRAAVSEPKRDAKSEAKGEAKAESKGTDTPTAGAKGGVSDLPDEKIRPLLLPEYKQIYNTPGNNWVKYPPKGPTSAEFPETEVEIELLPKPEEVERGIKDNKGFEPRNYKINVVQDPRDPRRQAMPRDFCNPARSLFEADNKTPRAATVEWINVKHKNDVDHLLTSREVADFIKRRGITYENIWFFDKGDEYQLRFDDRGRPLNPVPGCDRLNLTGPGFYFWLGPNFAVDITFTLQHEGEHYIFVIHGKGDAENMLRLVGGMRDIDKNNVAQRMFIELQEETGVLMNQVALEADHRMERITSKITDEARATRHAYTQTIFSAVRFRDLADIRKYIVKIDPQDNHEADQRFLINLSYLYEHHLREGAPGKMFSGHDKLILELIRKDAALERYVMDERRRAHWREKSRAEASLDLNHLLTH